MTTARSAILAAWQPLLAAQHIAVRMILDRYAEELARLAVQAVCPTEGERLVPRFELPGAAAATVEAWYDGKPLHGHMAVLSEAVWPRSGPVPADIEQALADAQRDFA